MACVRVDFPRNVSRSSSDSHYCSGGKKLETMAEYLVSKKKVTNDTKKNLKSSIIVSSSSSQFHVYYQAPRTSISYRSKGALSHKHAVLHKINKHDKISILQTKLTPPTRGRAENAGIANYVEILCRSVCRQIPPYLWVRAIALRGMYESL